MPAQDELVSTSTVRELMGGVLERHKVTQLKPAEIRRLNELFNDVSRVRLPTKFSGYSLRAESMQHPTADGTGLFADSKKTSKLHSRLDRERRQRVSDAMNEELGRGGSTMESVINAGLREGISFTLNEFTAPILAKDVKPFAARGNASKAELDAQMQAREHLKSVFVRLGGTQASGRDLSRGREWSSRKGRGRRDVSPSRR